MLEHVRGSIFGSGQLCSPVSYFESRPTRLIYVMVHNLSKTKFAAPNLIKDNLATNPLNRPGPGARLFNVAQKAGAKGKVHCR